MTFTLAVVSQEEVRPLDAYNQVAEVFQLTMHMAQVLSCLVSAS
jgi:hypothetical protein